MTMQIAYLGASIPEALPTELPQHTFVQVSLEDLPLKEKPDIWVVNGYHCRVHTRVHPEERVCELAEAGKTLCVSPACVRDRRRPGLVEVSRAGLLLALLSLVARDGW